MSAEYQGLLAVGLTMPESLRLYGLALLGLGLLIALALGVVLYLISREGKKEAEEMRKLVRHMRKLKERNERDAALAHRRSPRAKRGKR